MLSVLAMLLALGDVGDNARRHLENGRAAIQQLRYDRALEELEAALRFGESGPAELGEILRLLGEASASMDLPDAATAHFQRWLALDPSATLGDVSPKIAQPFADAKAVLAGRALRVHYETSRAPAASVTLVVDSDPMAMVAGARATVGQQKLEGRGTTRITLPVPATRSNIVLAALDRHGNRLAELAVDADFSPAPDPPGPPLYARWWTWAAAGGAATIAGVAFGLRAVSEHDDANRFAQSSRTHDYRETIALQDAAQRDALIANISYGVAGACAVVSLVMLLRESRSPRRDAALMPTLSPGTAGMALHIRF